MTRVDFRDGNMGLSHKTSNAETKRRRLEAWYWAAGIVTTASGIVFGVLNWVHPQQSPAVNIRVTNLVSMTQNGPSLSERDILSSNSVGTPAKDKNVKPQNVSVDLCLPSVLNNPEIWVDGSPANIIDKTPSFVTVLVNKQDSPHLFHVQSGSFNQIQSLSIQSNHTMIIFE